MHHLGCACLLHPNSNTQFNMQDQSMEFLRAANAEIKDEGMVAKWTDQLQGYQILRPHIISSLFDLLILSLRLSPFFSNLFIFRSSIDAKVMVYFDCSSLSRDAVEKNGELFQLVRVVNCLNLRPFIMRNKGVERIIAARTRRPNAMQLSAPRHQPRGNEAYPWSIAAGVSASGMRPRPSLFESICGSH